jgi:hypothetical protein
MGSVSLYDAKFYHSPAAAENRQSNKLDKTKQKLSNP